MNKDVRNIQMAKPKHQPTRDWGFGLNRRIRFPRVKAWFSALFKSFQERYGNFKRNLSVRAKRLEISHHMRKWYFHFVEKCREKIRIKKTTLIFLIMLTILLSCIFSILLVGCYHGENSVDPQYETTSPPALTNTTIPTLTFTPTFTSTSTPEPLPENK